MTDTEHQTQYQLEMYPEPIRCSVSQAFTLTVHMEADEL